MDPISFPCPLCCQRMAVGPEWAGKPVRCPHCKQVTTAPLALAAAMAPAVPERYAPPEPSRSQKPECQDSIFADPHEADPDCALGGSATPTQTAPTFPSRPSLPKFPEPTPLPPGSIQPFVPAPAPAQNPWAGYAPAPVVPADAPQARTRPRSTPELTLGRKCVPAWVTLAVSAWAFAATVLAAWGWLRSPEPAAVPAVVKSAKPASR